MSINSVKRWLKYTFGGVEKRNQVDTKRRWRAADGDHTLRLRYPLTKESVVLDVGGYRGQWTSDIYAMYRCHVHVFEPIPAFADLIAERFSANPDITLHRVALGANDGDTPFSDAADSTGQWAISGLLGSQTTVPVHAATPYFRQHSIEHIDLMKINIEGDEYDLLEHLAATDMIRNINHVQVQFHPFVPDADRRLERAHTLLAKTHTPQYQFRYIWESWVRK